MEWELVGLGAGAEWTRGQVPAQGASTRKSSASAWRQGAVDDGLFLPAPPAQQLWVCRTSQGL